MTAGGFEGGGRTKGCRRKQRERAEEGHRRQERVEGKEGSEGRGQEVFIMTQEGG